MRATQKRVVFGQAVFLSLPPPPSQFCSLPRLTFHRLQAGYFQTKSVCKINCENYLLPGLMACKNLLAETRNLLCCLHFQLLTFVINVISINWNLFVSVLVEYIIFARSFDFWRENTLKAAKMYKLNNLTKIWTCRIWKVLLLLKSLNSNSCKSERSFTSQRAV